eukprot:scaffold32837_cov129-Isochrysis_galbana.AAC.1
MPDGVYILPPKGASFGMPHDELLAQPVPLQPKDASQLLRYSLKDAGHLGGLKHRLDHLRCAALYPLAAWWWRLGGEGVGVESPRDGVELGGVVLHTHRVPAKTMWVVGGDRRRNRRSAVAAFGAWCRRPEETRDGQAELGVRGVVPLHREQSGRLSLAARLNVGLGGRGDERRGHGGEKVGSYAHLLRVM